MWRQRLAPYCVAGTSTWCLCKPRHCASPSGALTSPGVWMSHFWSMPRYMQFQALDLSPLHSYISTIYSLRPQGLCLVCLSVCSRSVQATSLGFKENERVTGIFRRYTSRPGQRLTHTVSNFEKFYLIYLFLTNTILNLYLSVAAPGFCLGVT